MSIAFLIIGSIPSLFCDYAPERVWVLGGSSGAAG